MSCCTENKLTKEEFAAFEGLEQSYVTMWEDIERTAPKCHFTTMFVDQAEDEAWWECKHCGHTKPFGGKVF